MALALRAYLLRARTSYFSFFAALIFLFFFTFPAPALEFTACKTSKQSTGIVLLLPWPDMHR